MNKDKLPPLPEPSIRFGAQSGLSGIEGYSAEQMEHFAISFAASLGTAPEGSWLWCKLMDWLRSRRLPPAEYGDLFAIVKEAHDLNKQDTVEPVGDEAMALHWIDRYACGVDDEPQLDRIRDALYQDNEALRQSQSLPAGAVAGLVGKWRTESKRVWYSDHELGQNSALECCADELAQALQADAREKGVAVGRCCYGGLRPKSACASCAAWTVTGAGIGGDGSVSVKQIPRRKAYPKPDENGNETGPIEQHAYIEGWNDCVAAIRLATSSQETASE